MSAKPIKVLLADDHDILLDGLRGLIEKFERVDVVGAVGNGLDALAFLETNDVDVVLTDLNMPLLNGLGLNWAIQKRFPAVRVLMLTMIDDAGQIREAIQSGIDGYILKNANKAELEQAILSVAAGHTYYGQAIVQRLAQPASDRLSTTALQPAELETLTAREREIATLVVQGLSNPEIAKRLFRSQLTVETHRRNIFRKLGVSSAVELVHYATKNGLIPTA